MAWFVDHDVRRLAGPRSYERGSEYADAVGDVDELPDGVVATVHGTEPYQVRLRDVGGSLDGECSCPYGQDGHFCKHCVAVSLALLADAPDPARGPQRRRKTRRSKPDVRAYLTSLDRDELVDLLLDVAADDPAVHRKLSLRAATNGDLDVSELRRLVNGLRSRGFLDYSGSFTYARKAGDVLDALDQVAAAHPDRVGPLYRLAAQHLTKTSEQADDSSGAIGEEASRAVAGYAAACRAAPPDPVDLARWMISFQLDGPGWPEVGIGDFADALGTKGLSAYWGRLTELRAEVGPASAGRFDHRRFTVTHLREEYLKIIARDVDALVMLYAEDLPEPYRYVQIGEVLRDAGRTDDAIAWLRRGQTEANRRDERIDALLADLCTTTGRYDEAADAYWRIFLDRPNVDSHRQLLDGAERAGALAETSERAMAHLRERAGRGGHQADPLVSILLDSGDVDGAWTAANEYGCSSRCMLNAAERRADTHPDDALPVYIEQVAAFIDLKNKSAYGDACKLLGVVKDLHGRAGRDFKGYLAEVKETHRRKRTFLAELARAGL